MGMGTINRKAAAALALGAGLLAHGAVFGAGSKGRIDKPSSRSVPSHTGKKRLNVVKKVTAETDASSSIISVFLERMPSWQRPKVRFQKNFVQVELKGITVLEPGKSYPTKSPHFKKIIPYQIKPGLAALRIYLAKPAAAYKKALSCDILGERLLVYLDHSFIEAKTADALRQERLAKEADAVIASTKVRRDIPDPGRTVTKKAKSAAKPVAKPVAKAKPVVKPGAKLALSSKAAAVSSDAVARSLNYDIPAQSKAPRTEGASKAAAEDKKEAKKEAESGATDPLPWEKNSSSAKAEGFYDKLQDKMKTVAIITVFLLLLLGGVHWYRKKMASAGGLAVHTPHGKLAIPSLKPLATYAIGPKQKLTLIGLHNKMILLGVSSDNIQYLYATDDADDPELSEKIKDNLGHKPALQGRRANPARSAAPAGRSATASARSATANGQAIAPTIPPRGVAKPKAPAVDVSRRGATSAGGQSAGGAAARKASPGARAYAAAQSAPQSAPQSVPKSAQRQGASRGDGKPGQTDPAPRQAIEDVTSLIRKKLKDLPSI